MFNRSTEDKQPHYILIFQGFLCEIACIPRERWEFSTGDVDDGAIFY